jgi:hypothetical protein
MIHISYLVAFADARDPSRFFYIGAGAATPIAAGKGVVTRRIAPFNP